MKTKNEIEYKIQELNEQIKRNENFIKQHDNWNLKESIEALDRKKANDKLKFEISVLEWVLK